MNSVFFRNMTVFWLHGEDFMFSSSVHHVQPRIPQMKMMKVHIPFTFKLQESSTASYTGKKNLLIVTVKSRKLVSQEVVFQKNAHNSLFCIRLLHNFFLAAIGHWYVYLRR